MENGGVGDAEPASPLNGETSVRGDITTDRNEPTPDCGSVSQSTDIIGVQSETFGKLSSSSTGDGLPTNNLEEAPSKDTDALPVNGDSKTSDKALNGDVGHDSVVVENDHVTVTATGEVVQVEKREETQESSATVEFLENPDGSEEFRLQEWKKIVLEEVTSKETERPASEEEMQALEQQQQQKQAADDGDKPVAESDETVVEISLSKDVLVDEYKRQESLHEHTVAGETVQSVQTVTEEHTTEEIREIPLPSIEPTSDSVADAGAEHLPVNQAADSTEAPAENNELPVPDTAANEPSVAESMVTSPSTDEVAAKEKGSKSKGIMGFLKARARSQSRERDEHGSKDEQRAKREQQPDEQKKSGTLERDKKFKLNLFSKKGDEEKTEDTDEVKQTLENDKEASKPKSLKKTLFGKKNKDKSVDDAAGDDKEKPAASEEHGEEAETKSKERKWFHFGKKPAKEAISVETNDAHTEKEIEETKPVAEEADKHLERAESHPAEAENEPPAVSENENEDVGKQETTELVAEVSASAQEATEVADAVETETSQEDKVADTTDEPESTVTNDNRLGEESAENVVPEVAEEAPASDGNETKVEEPQTSSDVNTGNVADEVEAKEVSPGGTLQKYSETEMKEQGNKDQCGKAPKKFSFGFKFGKKQKNPTLGDTAADQHANEDENALAANDPEHQTVEQASDLVAENVQAAEPVSDAKQAPEEAKHKHSKIKLFHFGKKSKSKQKDDDEKEHHTQEEDHVEGPKDDDDDEQTHVGEKADEPPVNDSEAGVVTTIAFDEDVTEKVAEADVGEEVREEITESKLESVECSAPETNQKESAEVSPVAAVEAPEPEVKHDPREQKKSLFGIKFGSKHDAKEDDAHVDDGTKVKEARWSPFGKKLGKKGTESGKNDAEVHTEELEHKTEDPEPIKEGETVTGEEVPADEATEAAEQTESSSKQHEAKDKSAHARMSKLFSFGKKEKAAEEKPSEAEVKAEEIPAEVVQPDAAAESSKTEGDVSSDKTKKAEEPEGEKKEESNFTTNIRKLFTIGKKNKDQHEDKKTDDANEEDTAAASEQKPQETSPEIKQKNSKVAREKSPHRKFPFEIKFGKKKEKEEVESPTKDVTSSEPAEEVAAVPETAQTVPGDQNVDEADQTVDVEVHSPEADGSKDVPSDMRAEKSDEVDETVAVEEVVQTVEAAVTESQPELAASEEVEAEAEANKIAPDTTTDDEENQPSKEAAVNAAERNEKAASEDTYQPDDQVVIAETETCHQVPTVSSDAPAPGPCEEIKEVIPDDTAAVTDHGVEQPEKPVPLQEQTEDVTVESTAAVDGPKKTEEVSAPDASGAKETKGRKRFTFGLKFGKRAERAKSAERAIPAKTTQTTVVDGDVKLELAKPVEASASVPDVRLLVEAEGGDQSTSATATDAEKTNVQTDTPTKSGFKHDLPHINIKWPHFGKKKQEEVDPASAEGEVKITAPIDESDRTSTPKKSQQQQQTPASTPLTDSQKKSSLGRGIFKMFSPRRHGDLHKSASCSAGDDKEPFVSYSVEGEGQIVAETQWRSKTLAAASGATDGKTAARLSKSPTVVEQRNQEPLVDVVADVLESRRGVDQVTIPGAHFVVVAIDFGTTYSGYAFSFARDAQSAAGHAGGIHMMRRWEGGDPGVVNQKTPTTILLTPGGEFHSFGFTARDFYHDLDPTEASKWLYFEKFKMDLHQSTELNSETTIRSSNGHEFPALQLFAISLRYFKEHALKELSSQSATIIVNEDVRWVITVPAIWKAPAKQFMRQAAYEAGIASADTPDNLLIALEPEAASIYIRQLRLSQLVPERSHVINRNTASPQKDATTVATSNGVEMNGDATTTNKDDDVINQDHVISDEFHAGTRYMVVDCGGGTVDITVHEMENESGNLKELYKATGGPYGSTGVDREFEKLLCEIFGNDLIESFKSKRPAGWVDLMIAFESRKRAAHPHKTNALNVSLPFSFIDFHKKYFGTQVESAIKKYSDKDVHWSMQGMLRLMPDAMKRLFHSTLESIKNAVSQVINNPQVSGIEYMFLVGGFAESPILQFEMRRDFEHLLKIVIPQEVSLTILKGAVCFGLDPTVVTVRKSRLTYGVGVLNRFIRGVHPESKLIRRGGGEMLQPEAEWCRDVFDLFVAADQSVGLGDTVLRRYTPAEHGQAVTVIHIYSAESPDVHFVTDDGVQRCGTLRLELAPAADSDASDGRGRRREIQTRMTFGDTEIKVWALDVASGRSVRAAIDFLNK